MASEARRWINHLLFLVLTMANLTRWCWCSKTIYCSQLMDDKNNSTGKLGPPVFDHIYDSVTEVRRWYTTRTDSLRCCVTANPVPEIIWYRNGRLLTFRNYRRTIENNGQVVTFNDVRTTDAGNYTCIARNKYGNISHSFLVKVTSMFVLQKPVVMLQPGPWKASVGNNVTISCTIMKSTRRPQVMWVHRLKNTTKPCLGNRYITPLKALKENGTWLSTLTILNVTMDDQGNYNCMARNGAGSGLTAQQNGTLIVLEFKPKTGLRQEEDSFFTKNPAFIAVIVVGVILVFITLGSILWLRKKSRSDRGADFPINDQSFPRPDYNPLLLNGDDIHVEIPVENLQLLRRAPGTDQDNNIDFDVFVSYSSMDREFVKNCLYAELITTHSVCIDFKDFEAGLFITDNIANSVFRSRKTLLVVTRNFLKGVWTFFEMQLAQGRLAEGHDVLILVLVENIPVHELPKPLQHYRQTKTYLEYFNEDVRPHFWDRLRSAIGPSLRQGTEENEGV